MISKYNYFDNSEGQFILLPAVVTDMLSEAYTIEICGKEVITTQKYVNFPGIGLFEPNFISFSQRYKTRSIYWVLEDGQKLLRLSDHWSTVPAGLEKSLKAVGKVRLCYWDLVGNEKTIADNQGRELVSAIINFKDMKEISIVPGKSR